MPPLTAEAQQRNQSAAAARKASGRGPADSYTDRSLYDRCITRGIAGSFLPVIYNNGNEIVQGPGWVAFRNEMIHETRIVPLDGRATLFSAITSFMGDCHGGNHSLFNILSRARRRSGGGEEIAGRLNSQFPKLQLPTTKVQLPMTDRLGILGNWRLGVVGNWELTVGN